MPAKEQPIGICDLCLGPIPSESWVTRRGPRRYCSRECRNTANSRAGAELRSRKARQRVARGVWQNPHHLRPPTSEEQAARARTGRLREVAAGRWRNPALAEEARRKLSRPRKHAGALHRAIERLRAGASVSQLTLEEQEAYRSYRRQLYAQKKAAMSETDRDQQRQKWRAAWHKRRTKP